VLTKIGECLWRQLQLSCAVITQRNILAQLKRKMKEWRKAEREMGLGGTATPPTLQVSETVPPENIAKDD
jgi:hypothetical protein